MAYHILNINFNVIQKTLYKSLNLVILNLHEWFTNNRLILNID